MDVGTPLANRCTRMAAVKVSSRARGLGSMYLLVGYYTLSALIAVLAVRAALLAGTPAQTAKKTSIYGQLKCPSGWLSSASAPVPV
jgi:hypothetical protein